MSTNIADIIFVSFHFPILKSWKKRMIGTSKLLLEQYFWAINSNHKLNYFLQHMSNSGSLKSGRICISYVFRKPLKEWKWLLKAFIIIPFLQTPLISSWNISPVRAWCCWLVEKPDVRFRFAEITDVSIGRSNLGKVDQWGEALIIPISLTLHIWTL